MNFYKGDIVEIINSEYKSPKDWHGNSEEPIPYIGQRFEIANIYFMARDKQYVDNYTGEYRNGLGHMFTCLYCKPHQIMLYRRPLRNWIKYFLKRKAA